MKYFVPEGTGRGLETRRNKRQMGVITRISKDGEAAIAGLQMDGKKVYEEPLF